jgi:hypothetical protein
MPDVQHTRHGDTEIHLDPTERFSYDGARIHSVTVPRSPDMSEPVTLHGTAEVGDRFPAPVEHRVHALEAVRAASTNPATAEALNTQVRAGLAPRVATVPSEALSPTARPAAAAVKAIPKLVR